jgi:hypothetical protein
VASLCVELGVIEMVIKEGDQGDSHMNVQPPLHFCRFGDLAPGDLFIYLHGAGSCVALKAVDPTQNGEPLILPFGPAFPLSSNGPYLLRHRGGDVVSFGKEYILRLPSHAAGWSLSEPGQNILCILASDEGYFIRGNHADVPGEFLPCYIDMATGRIQATDRGWLSEFIRPHGLRAVALEWELLTTEPKPRLIFSQCPAERESDEVP